MQFPANPTLVVVLQSHIFSFGVAASRGNRFLSRCDVSNIMAEDRSFMEDSARESGLGHCNARKAPKSAPAQNGTALQFFPSWVITWRADSTRAHDVRGVVGLDVGKRPW